MGYGFKKEQLNTGMSFPVAANIDNVYIEVASYELIKDQYPTIQIVWATKDGKRLTHNIFGVNEDDVKAFQGMSLEDTIELKYNQINTTCFKIAQGFGVSREELQNEIGSTDSFKTFATKYCKYLSEISAGKFVKLKTLRGKRGYVEIAERGNFILPQDDDMDLEYSAWELKYNEKNKGQVPSSKAQDTTAPNGMAVPETEVEVEDEESWFAEDDQ